MKKLGSLSLAAALIALPVSASAADGIDPDVACPVSKNGKPASIEPVPLLYLAIASGGQMQPGLFDTDLDGNETAGERLNALFDSQYCAESGKSRCGKGDQGKLDIAQVNLRAFLSNHVIVVTTAEPTATDIGERPLLADDEYGYFAKILDERKRFARLVCKARDAKIVKSSTSDRLRVSNTVDGMSLKRGTPDLLASVPQAELTFQKDNAAHATTLDIAAVIGYEFSNRATTRLIPYIEVRNKQVSNSDTDTKKWGIGFLYGHIFNDSLDGIDLATHYAHDRTTGAKFAALKAIWSPGFLYDIKQIPFGGSREYKNFAWKLDARLLAEAGHVFEVGTSTISEDDAEYFRLGPSVSATVWLLSSNPFLSKISFDASYKNLLRINGPSPLIRFSAGINYSPIKTDHFSFRLSYDKGKEDDTLKPIDAWKLSLGVRY